jgi:phosphate transport system ATP-binding protein
MTGSLKISVDKLSIYYGPNKALNDLSFGVQANMILGIIGPAGSGKTAFLRALNRLNDLNTDCRLEGTILMDGADINAPEMDVVSLRRKVGMLFALPIALPMSIYDNISYGPRLAGIKRRGELDELVESSLQASFLWEEVKDRLHTSGLRLSGGQQQRLCLARVLAMKPEVILLDEPCSGLDPISTAKIEEALISLKDRHTIILVTNNTKQAARVADNTAFFLMGELIELGQTQQVFTAPADKQTDEYISGRFG